MQGEKMIFAERSLMGTSFLLQLPPTPTTLIRLVGKPILAVLLAALHFALVDRTPLAVIAPMMVIVVIARDIAVI
jgi:hypothetical protein